MQTKLQDAHLELLVQVNRLLTEAERTRTLRDRLLRIGDDVAGAAERRRTAQRQPTQESKREHLEPEKH